MFLETLKKTIIFAFKNTFLEIAQQKYILFAVKNMFFSEIV